MPIMNMVRVAVEIAALALFAVLSREVTRLQARGFELLDTQWLTPHLATFGAHEISRAAYRLRLHNALGAECRFAE